MKITEKSQIVSFITDQYLQESIRSIDSHFGDGYAKKNPDLVGTYITVASYEFRTSTWCKALWEVAEAIERIPDND